MRVDVARAAAVDWVHRHQAGEPGFRGAYFAGSVIELAADAPLPATSDVDVVVVLAGGDTPPKLGKLQHRGVLLEVTQLPEAQLADADAVAATFFLAPSFRTDQIISDPTGLLHRLLARVSGRFAEPAQIRLRCDDVLRRMTSTLATLEAARPWPDQVTSCLFGVSLPTLVVLVAAQRNPTVRLRYLRARAVLQEQGHLDFYEGLLGALGCAGASSGQVQRHLDRLAVAFDRTARVAVTPFFFSNDITALARPVAIAGTQELIDAGDHREAVFWLLATFSRCMQVLTTDAPALAVELAGDFDAAVAELMGCRTPADLRRRADDARALLPELQRVAADIVDTGSGRPGDGNDKHLRDGPRDRGEIVTDLTRTQALLTDSFERIRDLVVEVTTGLDPAAAGYRPDASANSIGWLVWHLSRVQDDHLAELAGVDQAWPRWRERFALPFAPDATGYGQSPADVAAVQVDAGVLDAYHAEVHELTQRYLDGLTEAELERVVDERWDPPVTVSVRLVSVIGDCLQHLGQASYVRGLTERRPG